jgi:glycosyltransferase involved in cell wall biosynthesis
VAICIIIPAFNAEKTIIEVTEEVRRYGLPLLVVNDGSTDSTAHCLDRLDVTTIRHCTNLGKGAALRTGFSWAVRNGFSGVITLDSDGQHDPSAIPLIASTAERDGFDILVASRRSQFEQMAGLRRYWNRFGVWCFRKRTGFVIDDSQSGYRYYSKRLLSEIELSTEGYEMEMEILMKAWRGGFRIGSIPVAARVADGRATSHYRPVRDTWRICKTFLKYM